jgi:serine/threonine-protein kinase ULK/ATG1
MEKKVKIKKVGPYLLLREIGSGASATVFKAKVESKAWEEAVGGAANSAQQVAEGVSRGALMKPYHKVAVKMIPISKLNERSLKRVQQEIDILTKLDHGNIVRILDYKKSENHWYLVFEYCQHGDLHNYIKTYFGGRLEERHAQ